MVFLLLRCFRCVVHDGWGVMRFFQVQCKVAKVHWLHTVHRTKTERERWNGRIGISEIVERDLETYSRNKVHFSQIGKQVKGSIAAVGVSRRRAQRSLHHLL